MHGIGGRARRGAVGEGGGKEKGRQLCGCWARAGRVVETAARAGEEEGRLERESMTSVTYLGEKRRASDRRPRRSDGLPPHVTANNPQGYRRYRGVLSVFQGERKLLKREGEGR